MEALLLRRRIRTDIDKEVIEDLGFGLEVWNQPPDSRATTISIRCGVYAEAAANRCLLNPPSKGEAVDRMLSIPTLTQLLTCMVVAWDPDWGVVTTNNALDLTSPKTTHPMEAIAGWMTYFSRRRGTVPPLPAPVRIEPVGSLGTLVILTPERFTASNSEHVSQFQRVSGLLERAGLFAP
jgi:hypothetical protein